MEISHFVLLSVLCVRQAKTHLSHQVAQNEKNMFIYIANFEFSCSLLLIFFSFHFHFTVIDDEDDDGIDIIMVVGLEVKWHMGRWLLVPLYQSHNWISMWPNTIFLSSIFHLLSPTKSDFNLGDKWFHEGCERLLTQVEYEKSGKRSKSQQYVSSAPFLQHCSKMILNVEIYLFFLKIHIFSVMKIFRWLKKFIRRL